MEPLTERLLVRIAQQIRDQLQGAALRQMSVTGERTGQLTGMLARIEPLRRQLNVACVRGWAAAAREMAERVTRAIRDLPHYIHSVEQAAESRGGAVPSARNLVADLQQLKEEFGEECCSFKDHVLAVTTEPIELQGVYLGPFAIRLDTRRLSGEYPERACLIVALDPQPAGGNPSVTHPHVSDDCLCAGDAATPIRSALSSGRICDFFLIVRSVLTHYNPDSPYVSLDNWGGSPCYDCGCRISSDESSWCTTCDHDYCGDCSSYCHLCMETTCLSCLGDCPVCEEMMCRSCLVTCPHCGKSICKSCLEAGECSCHEDEEKDNEEEQRQQAEAGHTAA